MVNICDIQLKTRRLDSSVYEDDTHVVSQNTSRERDEYTKDENVLGDGSITNMNTPGHVEFESHRPQQGSHPRLAKVFSQLLDINSQPEPSLPELISSLTERSDMPLQQLSARQKMRAFVFAGIAPSKFNLRKIASGKETGTDKTLPNLDCQWPSNRPKNNWMHMNPTSNGDSTSSNDIFDMSENEKMDSISHDQLPYIFSLRQGFKFRNIFRHQHQFLSVVQHLRVPVHFSDGSIGHDIEKDVGARHTLEDQNDISNQKKAQQQEDDKDNEFENTQGINAVSRSYSITTLDRNNHINVWDLGKQSRSKPRFSIQMDHKFLQIIFLSRYALYAGVVDQKTVKFFTSKMEITSTVNAPHLIHIIQYSSHYNEIVVAGTHNITVWSLSAAHQKGRIQINAIQRMAIETGLGENEWLSSIYIDKKNKQIWVVIDVSLMIFDYFTGKKVEYVQNIASRKITCISSHDAYQYILIGSVDGTLKVLNTVRAVVHEFVSHAKSVTAISVYSYGPLILSCGLDCCVRLYNLKSFREIFSFHVQNTPQEMQLIDDTQLYIAARNTIEIWDTNQININLSTLSSSISSLTTYKSPTAPNRVVVCTRDGVIRLSSPTSGQAITATLPLIEADSIRDISYFPAIASEDCVKIVLFEGYSEEKPTSHSENSGVSIKNHKDFTTPFGRIGPLSKSLGLSLGSSEVRMALPTRFGFLFGATHNGHLLVYGKGGAIVDRYQLHMGTINHIICDSEQKLLFSTGRDKSIRISRILPGHENFIQIVISIQLNFNPLLTCVMGDIICVSSEDYTLHMFKFNIETSAWQKISGHSKTEDHTDEVTSICCLPKLGIFITIGKDASMRVWDKKNALIRDIQFQERVDGLCVANQRGDLLIAIQNRIDIIQHISYLPSNYLDEIMSSQIKEDKAELPLLFDDTLISLMRSPLSIKKRPPLRLDRSNPWSVFSQINICEFDVDELEEVKIDFGVEFIKKRHSASTSKNILENLDHRYRGTISALQNKRSGEQDNKQSISSTEEGMTNEASATISTVFGSETESVESNLVQNDHPIKPIKNEKDHVSALPFQETLENSSFVRIATDDFVQDGSIDLSAKAPEKNHVKNGIFIAPDGYIPNSGIISQVNTWLDLHGKPALIVDATKSYKLHESPHLIPDDKSKRLHSDQYKAKLKDLMLHMKPPENSVQKITKEEPVSILKEDTDSDEIIKMRIRRRMQARAEEIVQQTLEIKLPPIIEKMMEYSWFPDEEIFYPTQLGSNYDALTIVTNSKGERMRNVKIDATSDGIIPVILRVYANSDLKTQAEISHFIMWINQEYGFRDTTVMEIQYCRQLQTNAFGTLQSDEITLRKRILDSLVDLNPNNAELIPTLLMYTNCMYDALRFKALQSLRSFGVTFDISTDLESSKKLQTLSIYGLEEIKREGERKEQLSKIPPKKKILRPTSPLLVSIDDQPSRSPSLTKIKDEKQVGLQSRTGKPLGVYNSTKKLKGRFDSLKNIKNMTHVDPKALGAADNRGISRDILQNSATLPKQGAELIDNIYTENYEGGRQKGGMQPTPSACDTVHADVSAPLYHTLTLPCVSFEKSLATTTKEIPISGLCEMESVHPSTEINVDPGVSLRTKASQLVSRVIGQRKKEYPTSLDKMFYPIIPVSKLDASHDGRRPIQILQSPTTANFVDAINYYMVQIELKAEQTEAELLNQAYLENLEMKRIQQDAEARSRLVQYKSQKAMERMARAKAREERIAALRRGDNGVADFTQPKGKVKFSEMRTGGVGHTHKSCCHQSREMLDVRMMLFPPISTVTKYMHSSLAIHMQTYSKVMPLEHVRLNPFGSSEHIKPTKERLPSRSSLSRPAIQSRAPPTHLAEVRNEDVHHLYGSFDGDVSTMPELEYIRGCITNSGTNSISLKPTEAFDDAHSFKSTDIDSEQASVHKGGITDSSFQSSRRYFVYDLSLPDGRDPPNICNGLLEEPNDSQIHSCHFQFPN
ncbi:hypothetical protein BASA60_007820 [Batrachochytrium salamandrivorans]|nr:hypothetical protein BASA60_007820 [Batrachochytrium salamandrivorans]